MGDGHQLPPIQRLEILIDELRHIGRIQVDAEQQYVARSNNITVLQGLLAVAAGSIGQSHFFNADHGLLLLGSLGLLLSAVWFLIEERNQLYFTARGVVLEEVEREVLALAAKTGAPFPAFWTKVPAIARQSADVWYKRFSAPMLQRRVIPLMAVVAWLAVAVAAAVRLM